MTDFVARHQDKILGTLTCFDRLIFRGHLPLRYSQAVEDFLYRKGILFKDLKAFLVQQADRLKEHAQTMAERAGRPYRYLQGPIDKQKLARAIADSDGIEEGLVCVFSLLEPCRTFRMVYGEGRPRIVSALRKCLSLYFYLIDKQFGFMHVRVQTWFPFTIQVYMNGHEYLARKLDAAGLRYHQVENAFSWLENPKRAQRFADGLANKNWPRILSRFARLVNPLLPDVLERCSYYWVTQQSELATDIMFRDREALRSLYPRLLRHATLTFSAEDVMVFLGRKLHGNFAGELTNEAKKRAPGARIKHRMKGNWIKMYDKHGVVLRVETVINDPTEFRVRKRVRRQGKWVTQWCEMRKGVANLFRYREVSLAANDRYLQALAAVEDPSAAMADLQKIGKPVSRQGRRARALNPLAREDLAAIRAIARGEFLLNGFRNADIRTRLFAPPRDPHSRRRLSAKVTRLLQRLHVHQLIAKIPRSRRWRLSAKGRAITAAIIYLHDQAMPDLVMKHVA
jgi:hypothetical protein